MQINITKNETENNRYTLEKVIEELPDDLYDEEVEETTGT